MNYSFTNHTVRSAEDLSADLAACRQLRHTSPAERNGVVEASFGEISSPVSFVWVYRAFEIAFSRHGAACDCCGDIVKIPHNRLRAAADRALDNLDGRLRLMLCAPCSTSFTTFCRREYDREARLPYSADLEKMMLAWVAQQVVKKASAIKRSAAGIRKITRPANTPNTPAISERSHEPSLPILRRSRRA